MSMYGRFLVSFLHYRLVMAQKELFLYLWSGICIPARVANSGECVSFVHVSVVSCFWLVWISIFHSFCHNSYLFGFSDIDATYLKLKI